MRAHCEALPPSGSRIALAGELTLTFAGELGDLLAGQLAGAAERLTVDLSAVTAVDLTAIQLLIAAHREAARQGKRLELAPTPAPAVRGLCAALGLTAEAGGEDSAGAEAAGFWRELAA